MALVSKEKIKKFFRHFFFAFVVSASVAQYSVASQAWQAVQLATLSFAGGKAFEYDANNELSRLPELEQCSPAQAHRRGVLEFRRSGGQFLQVAGVSIGFVGAAFKVREYMSGNNLKKN